MNSLKSVCDLVAINRKKGYTTAFNTGCYDILTVDHVRFLDFMKQNANFVVIGLESDESIKLNKGANRPVNTFSHRAEILLQLKSVDDVFEVPFVCDFNGAGSNELYDNLAAQIFPNFIATSKLTGSFLTQKNSRTQKLGIDLLIYSETSLLVR